MNFCDENAFASFWISFVVVDHFPTSYLHLKRNRYHHWNIYDPFSVSRVCFSYCAFSAFLSLAFAPPQRIHLHYCYPCFQVISVALVGDARHHCLLTHRLVFSSHLSTLDIVCGQSHPDWLHPLDFAYEPVLIFSSLVLDPPQRWHRRDGLLTSIWIVTFGVGIQQEKEEE